MPAVVTGQRDFGQGGGVELYYSPASLIIRVIKVRTLMRFYFISGCSMTTSYDLENVLFDEKAARTYLLDKGANGKNDWLNFSIADT